MKQKKNKKKILLIVLISFVSAVVLLYFILGAIYRSLKNDRTKVDYSVKQDGIYYYPIGYGDAAADDKYYLSLDRGMYYTELGVTERFELDDGDLSDSAKLFASYFKTLIGGDAAAHKALFSKEFFTGYVLPDEFTSQKIYDIHVTLDDRTFDDSGFYKEYFKVEYRILENNGTYRANVSSDQNVPLEFEVYRYENGAEINAIFEIKIKT